MTTTLAELPPADAAVVVVVGAVKAIAKSDPIFVDVIVTKMLAGGTSQNPKNSKKNSK